MASCRVTKALPAWIPAVLALAWQFASPPAGLAAADPIDEVLRQWNTQRTSVRRFTCVLEGTGTITTGYRRMLQTSGILQPGSLRTLPYVYPLSARLLVDPFKARARIESEGAAEFNGPEGWQIVRQVRTDIYDGKAYRVLYPRGKNELSRADVELHGQDAPARGLNEDLFPLFFALGFVGDATEGLAAHTLKLVPSRDEFTVQMQDSRAGLLVIERAPAGDPLPRLKRQRFVLEKTGMTDEPYRLVSWHDFVGTTEHHRCEIAYADAQSLVPSGWNWFEFGPPSMGKEIIRKMAWTVRQLDENPPPMDDKLFQVSMEPGMKVADHRPGADVMAYRIDSSGRHIPTLRRPGLAQPKPRSRMPWITLGGVGLLLVTATCLFQWRKRVS